MTERLFLALWPGERQRSGLAKVQRELPGRRGRLTHPADFHITLVFLGDIGAHTRACVEKVAGLVRAAPFVLTLDRSGSFPLARVLWCGASACPRSLVDLLNTLESGLLDCGFRPERRPYAPHVTLARKARPLPARELENPIAWPVAEFTLVHARAGERPRYRVVGSWPLVS